MLALGQYLIPLEVNDMKRSGTEALKRKYDRVARYYDVVDLMISKGLRQRVIHSAEGQVLEVGVGTGINLPLYPPDCAVTGIDISPGMLGRARKRAQELDLSVELAEGDVQNLEYADQSFDTVVATCVFCTVPDPIMGLKEVRRVCKTGGKILLLEHVRSENRILGALMDLVNPVVVWALGDNINRRTVDAVEEAGIHITELEDAMGSFMKIITAQP